MTGATLTATRLRAGIWEGLLTGPTSLPQLEAMHLETALDGLRVTQIAGQSGQWAVQLPIPSHCVSDGIQTFIIREIGTTTTLAHFAIVAGAAMVEDIAAEMDLLRAELDLLKRAFRRHCVETAGNA